MNNYMIRHWIYVYRILTQRYRLSKWLLKTNRPLCHWNKWILNNLCCDVTIGNGSVMSPSYMKRAGCPWDVHIKFTTVLLRLVIVVVLCNTKQHHVTINRNHGKHECTLCSVMSAHQTSDVITLSNPPPSIWLWQLIKSNKSVSNNHSGNTDNVGCSRRHQS